MIFFTNSQMLLVLYPTYNGFIKTVIYYYQYLKTTPYQLRFADILVLVICKNKKIHVHQWWYLTAALIEHIINRTKFNSKDGPSFIITIHRVITNRMTICAHCHINQNNNKIKRPEYVNETQRTKINWSLFQNNNSLSIYNKSLSMAGYTMKIFIFI